MTQDSTANSNAAVPKPPGLAWFMRRAAIGVCLLLVFIVSMAWLTHTSLQADTEANVSYSDEDPIAPPANAEIIRAVAPAATERHHVKAE